MEDKELRYSTIDNLEVRQTENNEELTISGYAITFNTKSQDLGGFVEIIKQDALKEVDLSDVYFLRNHDDNFVLGSTKSETMKLEVTERGLYFEVDLPKTVRGLEIYELVKRGDLDSLSFGFTVAKDTWNVRQSPEVRQVEQIGRLFEISLVNFPAYKESKISSRSLNTLNECRECRMKETEKTEEINKLTQEALEILETIKK